MYGTYLDKAESVSFKINAKSQPKMTTSIFSSLNEEKPKGSSSENVQKEVSGEYCKPTIRNDFYFTIYTIYLRWTGLRRLIFTTKPYPHLFFLLQLYCKYWSTAWYIRDNEALATLSKKISVRIQVGLHYILQFKGVIWGIVY